jgi:serine/threonine protein kinase
MESPMSGVQPLEPGDPAQVGAYRLLGRLGAGGMGQVFLGVSRGGRKVAVKVLRADLVTDAEFRARFAREVAVARTVNGFYTAPVVDAAPDATPPWMVTAYVQGPSRARPAERA